jgi:hypothetical protein
MANKHFNIYSQTDNKEFDLINNQTHELIEKFGIPVKYIPREIQNHNFILGEDELGSFTDYYEVNMYLENYSDFNGSGDLFAKFGMNVDDQMSLIIQQEYIINKIGRTPLPGDLIWFEFNNIFLEVFNVEPEKASFYFTGKQVSYLIECRKWEYSAEDIQTGDTELDEIDDFEDVNTSDEQDQIDNEYSNVIDDTTSDPFTF